MRRLVQLVQADGVDADAVTVVVVPRLLAFPFAFPLASRGTGDLDLPAGLQVLDVEVLGDLPP